MAPSVGRLTPCRRPSALGVVSLSIIAVVVAVLSYAAAVGADTMWLVALGNEIASRRAIPVGVPFLDADTSHWVNVPVLGELVLAGANGLGPWGLLTLQLLAVAATLVLLAQTATRLGARDAAVGVTLLLFVVGGASSLGLVRAQTLSLPCFAVLLLLLRREQIMPSRLVWFVPVITLVWGNLHGAVLMGVAVAGCYLLFSRARRQPPTAVAVTVAMLASLWATPGGLRTHVYYWDVLNNAAARRGEGLWTPLSMSSIFDVALVVTVLVLLGLALSRWLPLWEYVALGGLLIATVQTSRHGVWLLMVLVPSAARHLGRLLPGLARDRHLAHLPAVLAVVAAGLAVPGVIVRSAAVAADAREAQLLAAKIGSNQSTLAPSPLAESLAVAGVRLWAGNPIDALPQNRQAAYLDFLAAPQRFAPSVAHAPARVVLKATQQPSQWVEAHYRLGVQERTYLIYTQVGHGLAHHE